MDKMQMALPVFLPGKNRDWAEWAGMATISEHGEIVITLQEKRAADALVQMAKDNVLMQLSFDYRMTPEMIKQINDRYKEKK